MSETDAQSGSHGAVRRWPDIPSSEFWKALSARAVGAAVVATAADSKRAGFFALSVTHLSPSPPTLIVSVSHSTGALAPLRASGTFSVNYLAETQRGLMDVFSGRAGLTNEERFHTQRWTSGRTGAPILEGAVGFLDCEVEEIIDRHAVALVIGRIVDFHSSADVSPLIHFRGQLQELAPALSPG